MVKTIHLLTPPVLAMKLVDATSQIDKKEYLPMVTIVPLQKNSLHHVIVIQHAQEQALNCLAHPLQVLLQEQKHPNPHLEGHLLNR